MSARANFISRAAVAAAFAMTTGVAMAETQTNIHRDSATRNTGGDPFMLQYARAFYCNLADDNNQIVLNSRTWNYPTRPDNPEFRIPTLQIFDDVWFVGNHYVGQYLIKTPQGLVQVDAGNTATEVEAYNRPAMVQLGWNAATYPLTGVFLTHGHGDHDGGAKWLLDNMGGRSYLGSADAAAKSYAPIAIDSTNLSFRQMDIGGKKFWVLPTPGHTNGSTSAVLEVQDWGTTRRVLINGGQSMTSSIPAVASYLDSIERTYTMVKALHVEGVMTPHIYWDGEGAKIRDIQANGRSNPSQHVYGHEAVVRQMVVARECSAAWLTRLDATRVLPSWRYNTLAFTAGSPTVNNVSARVSNGWGPLTGQSVTFSVDGGGASCTATTDADGVASCAIRPLRPHRDTVTASFAGAESAEFVDLPAQASALVCDNGNCNTK